MYLIRQWLEQHAIERRDATAFSAWNRGMSKVEDVTFGELSQRAQHGALRLRALGMAAGERVVLVLPNSIDFVAVFCAIVQGAGVAVPAPAPSVSRPSAFRVRIESILADCNPILIVTTTAWREELKGMAAVKVVAAEEVLSKADEPGDDAPASAGGRTVALQYTSGSTSAPKGVELTESMIEASCRLAALAYEEHAGDTAVTWVPLFHDMGLVTGLLRPLRGGYRSVLMSPEDFVARPSTWLRLISRERATLSSAPNFGYDLCVRRADLAELEGDDLSTWRVARNAGEVVQAETLKRFAETFAPLGFAAESACPSYGLAEATLTVTTSRPGRLPKMLKVFRDDLLAGSVREHDGGDLEVASSGTPLPDTTVRIAGGGSDGVVGEVMVRGPQTFEGYWSRPRPARTDGYHATGDLGFLWSGELFVIGRETDMLTVNGRNFHLHADVLPGLHRFIELRPGRIGIFTAPSGGRELVHLAAEFRRGAEPDPAALDDLRTRIRMALLRQCDLHVHGVHFCAAGSLPVTTSGKVRLPALRDLYVDGRLELI